MSTSESIEDRGLDDMASQAALKTAKKELRSLMKKKLSEVSSSSVDTQSMNHILHISLTLIST
jgi:hypothetical protein